MVRELGQLPIPADPESWLSLRFALRDAVMEKERQLGKKIDGHRCQAEDCQDKLDTAITEPDSGLEERESDEAVLDQIRVSGVVKTSAA